ncbi:MAG: RidA family protein [Provencibacterium sp.]|jgi:enamine deaminase RidA (YjgF/YER057c/UK114 family)|nr:RidA family protein [Provencibacterium sp.]
MDVYEKLKELGLKLPPAPAKGGVYSPCKRFGENLIYISGCGPAINGKSALGKLGAEISLEEGQRCARDCMLNVLAVLEAEVGDLNRVAQPVKILTFVAGTDSFYSQPQVANGGSELLQALFGDVPSRSAIGVNALPGNIPVETEALFELKK